MNELWRPVVGYEGTHEVSTEGRLRTLDRIVETRLGRRSYRGRVLKLWEPEGHYSQVRVFIFGEPYAIRVHLAVATAFLGPRPEGLEVCHNNGDRHDNRVDNLRYDTRQANALDTLRHGHNAMASRTHCKNGHEFTPANTAFRTDYPTGRARRCLTCRQVSNARRRQVA